MATTLPTRTGPSGSNADPAVVGYAVTPSDTVDLAQGPCRGLYVGVTGNLTIVQNQAGTGPTAVLYTAVPVGVLPIGCTRVNATATTATGIVALY